jgi:hypothetical protein
MTERHIKRPRDPIQLAKLIGDIATGQVDDRLEDGKDTEAVKNGREGGKRGGPARAQTLSPDRRQQIARDAAAKRWSK